MLDALDTYWAWVSALLSDPRVQAALPALIVSWGVSRDLKASALCAVVAYSSINLIMWLTSMPVAAASGVGTCMALMGLNDMQSRIKRASLTDVIKTVVKAVKDRR